MLIRDYFFVRQGRRLWRPSLWVLFGVGPGTAAVWAYRAWDAAARDGLSGGQIRRYAGVFGGGQ